jgi:hypothetical protein
VCGVEGEKTGDGISYASHVKNPNPLKARATTFYDPVHNALDKRYVLLGHNQNRFMVERPFYWCTKPTPTKLFIPLNYIEWSVGMLESGDFMTKLSKILSRFVGGMHSVQSG